MLKWLLLPILSLAPVAAAPFERWAGKPADAWQDAFPIRSATLATRVWGGTVSERLPISETFHLPGPSLGELRLDWLDKAIPVTGYRRSLDLATGIATTSFKRDDIRITETIFFSRSEDLLVVHLHADRPGALNFQASLADQIRIEDRREILSRHLHVWVLPFESDVETRGPGLAVRGEGEALILVAARNRGTSSERFRALARKFDGRDTFPDLTRVWAGLRKSQESAISGD